jgi:hypothetical protein
MLRRRLTLYEAYRKVQPYLLARSAWEPEIDVRAIARDWCALHLGPANAEAATEALMQTLGPWREHYIGDKVEPKGVHPSYAKNRPQGTRANASNWSLFGLDVGPGSHEIQFRPTTPLTQGGVMLADTRRDMPTFTLEIVHEPLATKQSPLLPQNWAWEARHTERSRLVHLLQ